MCCDGKWRPFLPVVNEQPTMTLRTKGPTKTVYQKDYTKHPIEFTRDMKNDLWSTFHNEEPMDFTTTMRVQFSIKRSLSKFISVRMITNPSRFLSQ